MKANVIEVEIGSCYEWTCDCGNIVRVTGPCHIQMTHVVCECGAVYQFGDAAELSIVIGSPVRGPRQQKERDGYNPPPPHVTQPSPPPPLPPPPIRPASLGMERITGKVKPKKGKK